MATVFIRQLQVPVIIGVFQQERMQSQTLLLDLELDCNIENAVKSDNVSDALDYALVRQYVLDYTSQTQYQLVETLASHLADKLLGAFSLSRVKLTLFKHPFDIEDAAAVGVIVERGTHE